MNKNEKENALNLNERRFFFFSETCLTRWACFSISAELASIFRQNTYSYGNAACSTLQYSENGVYRVLKCLTQSFLWIYIAFSLLKTDTLTKLFLTAVLNMHC